MTYPTREIWMNKKKHTHTTFRYNGSQQNSHCDECSKRVPRIHIHVPQNNSIIYPKRKPCVSSVWLHAKCKSVFKYVVVGVATLQSERRRRFTFGKPSSDLNAWEKGIA